MSIAVAIPDLLQSTHPFIAGALSIVGGLIAIVFLLCYLYIGFHIGDRMRFGPVVFVAMILIPAIGAAYAGVVGTQYEQFTHFVVGMIVAVYLIFAAIIAIADLLDIPYNSRTGKMGFL